MRPPEDHEADCRDPLSVAVWAEARARWWLLENPRSDNRSLRAAMATAYRDVARLIVGLAEGATFREIRYEIYVRGHERGIVPWEDPEAAERKPVAPERPQDLVGFLEGIEPGFRLRTLDLDAPAAPRDDSTTPSEAAGYADGAEGELVPDEEDLRR